MSELGVNRRFEYGCVNGHCWHLPAIVGPNEVYVRADGGITLDTFCPECDEPPRHWWTAFSFRLVQQARA